MCITDKTLFTIHNNDYAYIAICMLTSTLTGVQEEQNENDENDDEDGEDGEDGEDSDSTEGTVSYIEQDLRLRHSNNRQALLRMERNEKCWTKCRQEASAERRDSTSFTQVLLPLYQLVSKRGLLFLWEEYTVYGLLVVLLALLGFLSLVAAHQDVMYVQTADVD